MLPRLVHHAVDQVVLVHDHDRCVPLAGVRYAEDRTAGQIDDSEAVQAVPVQPDAGNDRWVAEVVSHVLFADPDERDACALLADPYSHLGYRAGSAAAQLPPHGREGVAPRGPRADLRTTVALVLPDVEVAGDDGAFRAMLGLLDDVAFWSDSVTP